MGPSIGVAAGLEPGQDDTHIFSRASKKWWVLYPPSFVRFYNPASWKSPRPPCTKLTQGIMFGGHLSEALLSPNFPVYAI